VSNRKSFILPLTALLLIFLLHGCCYHAKLPDSIPGAVEFRTGLNCIANDSKQALIVLNRDSGSSRAVVLGFEKRASQWNLGFGPLMAVIGKAGFAAPGFKREGDGRTPSGIFPLGTTFGYAESIQTRMPYRQAKEDDLWVDDTASDDYNQWVKKDATRAASFENLLRKDNLYQYGIVIEYNTSPVIKGMGSAIFIHLWRGEGIPTEGCIALSEKDMQRILEWLDPNLKPFIAMGTQTTLEGFLR